MDCKDKASCLGNRLEIVIIDGQERIKLIAPHHKTEGTSSVESSSPSIADLKVITLFPILASSELVNEGTIE
jgi:hypothetical protein